MELAKTIKSVRSWVNVARSKGKKIGFVPTMGALHIGHISLIEAARKNTDFVVVSIFVNPTQFGPGEDFEKYPRPLDTDLEICKKAGADVVFAPSAKEMYPMKNLTWVNVEKLTAPLCGRCRPGHFRGVATVCTKFFNIVAPDIAFFGQKDAQQVAVVKKMAADLNMSLEIVVCPTVREKTGLAISSRNRYLTAQEKKDAASIYKSLRKCEQMVKEGIRETEPIIAQMRKILSPVSSIEYISIVDARTLETIDKIAGPAIAAVAVKIGSTRLIDNILIEKNS
jgi:pantoate--beta-alanine ligase